MNKPKLTREQALAQISTDNRSKIISGSKGRNSVFLIGFRGYYMDSMGKPGENDRGIYDDAICVVTPDEFLAYNANTDPSRHKQGVATLIPGVYPYRKGKHGITTHADGGYWAFRPATPNEAVPVTRDGQAGTSMGIAINIHKGGYTTTSSEGCQTIHPDQWPDFQRLVYALMDRYEQKIIQYALIEWVQ
jgi:lysozyme